MKMPNTKYTGSFIKGGPGENQSYKKYYGKMLTGFKEGVNRKKLTSAQKYNQLKKQTESAGMKVKEINGKIVVTEKGKNNGYRSLD
jgi:hypothetical protein